MRDPHFKLIRRGGLLTDGQHHQLMEWALLCTTHLLSYKQFNLDPVLLDALDIARLWQNGEARVLDAMQASRAVHRFARSVEDVQYQLVCRAIGQAVATAHMADHSMGPCWYGAKLVRLLGYDAKAEQKYQLEQLLRICPTLCDVVGAHLSEFNA